MPASKILRDLGLNKIQDKSLLITSVCLLELEVEEVLLEEVTALNLLKHETSDLYGIILCLLECVRFALHFVDFVIKHLGLSP